MWESCREMQHLKLNITQNLDQRGIKHSWGECLRSIGLSLPCSTNHVEINDVYVCIYNGGESRGSQLCLSYHLLTRTNMNIMEWPSLWAIAVFISVIFISISQSTNQNLRNHIDINDKHLVFYINILFIETIAMIQPRTWDVIILLSLIWKKSSFFSVCKSPTQIRY